MLSLSFYQWSDDPVNSDCDLSAKNNYYIIVNLIIVNLFL